MNMFCEYFYLTNFNKRIAIGNFLKEILQPQVVQTELNNKKVRYRNLDFGDLCESEVICRICFSYREYGTI